MSEPLPPTSLLPTPLLKVAGLDAFYGRAQAAFGVNLEVHAGEVVALLGRNGAGKSTILKAIAGLVERRLDRLELDGKDVRRLSTYKLVRAGVGFVPEDRRIFTDLTVYENLETGRQPTRKGAPEWTPERLFELFPNLADMRGRSARQMSGGEQQMLTIARTLMGNPRVVLLDEPSEGLSPRIVELMAMAILRLKRDGLAILLSEQSLRFARYVGDTCVVIERGTIRFSGPIDELDSSATADQALRPV